MPNDDGGLQVVDTANLTDEDWAEINRLGDCHDDGGMPAVSKAVHELSETAPVRYFRIMAAFFPDNVRNALLDEMANAGLTEADLREWISQDEGERH